MKSLLVVVDFQVDFVCGALGFSGAARLEGPICAAIASQRQRGGDVCFTMDTHTEKYLETQEGRHLPVVHCVRGTEGWALFGRVADLRREEDPVFEKPGFGSLDLMRFVQAGEYDEVTLVGLVSHICVMTNALLVKTALPEAQVRVDCACTDSFDPILHKKALDVMHALQVECIHRGAV
ncbi:MAG: cysteine hydrolase family protein [Oscillospiraceae bacterium]|jgi:nicotinamidase/pyrazinamidase